MVETGSIQLTQAQADALLQGTSRSFSLTVRVLPRTLRDPISLAYLLARATDTVADTTAAGPRQRLELLRRMNRDVLRENHAGDRAHNWDPATGTALRELAQAHAGENAREADLLRHWDALQLWLQRLQPGDRDEIQRVIRIIVSGQKLDLERFEPARAGEDSGGRASELIAIPSAQDLRDYTYRVAGCVGEFWTALCVRHLPDFSVETAQSMQENGRNFGQGLQLVNVLRDVPKDLAAGRCYLPEEDLREAGLTLQELQHLDAETYTKLRPVLRKWLGECNALLEHGWHYTLANRGWRLRVACALPVLLGFGTLSRLCRADWTLYEKGVKVPRAHVKNLVLRTALASPSRRMLARVRWSVERA
jgi:farnesyl-diphosphate farnesyltransferase